MFMCPFKMKFVGILTLIFKEKESGKMSARGTHALKLSEGELTNPPVLGRLCSLNIDTNYVIYFFKYKYYFEYYAVDGFFFYAYFS